MNSIAFPNIFNTTTTNIYKDHQATVSNLILTLQSARGSLFGDPDFGTNLKKLIYDQGDSTLMELVTEDIYVTIKLFVPQLLLERSDITFSIKDNVLFVNIQALNLIDYQTDMYNIALLQVEEE